MPKAQRERRERTDKYHLILQWCHTPEQRLYEGIRPITLFGVPPAERAEETGVAESTLRRAANAFDTQGMISLFRPTKAQRESHHRSLPVMMRQLIVDLKTEYPDFTLGEIAEICAINFDGRRPSHHTVKEVLADGPRPSRTTRQFPRYEEIADPEERRLAVIRLHAQGWSISSYFLCDALSPPLGSPGICAFSSLEALWRRDAGSPSCGHLAARRCAHRGI